MTAADDGLATNERVRAFLDGLAALTTTHGLVLDVYQGTICLDPVPADSRSFGGYAAAHRSGNYWEVYPFEWSAPLPLGRIMRRF